MLGIGIRQALRSFFSPKALYQFVDQQTDSTQDEARRIAANKLLRLAGGVNADDQARRPRHTQKEARFLGRSGLPYEADLEGNPDDLQPTLMQRCSDSSKRIGFGGRPRSRMATGGKM